MIPGTTYNYSSIAKKLFEGDRNENSNIAKGFLAGLIGGLVGTGLKSIAEKYLPPRPVNADTPPAIVANQAAEALTGDDLTEDQEAVAEQGIHWLFGGLVGGAYGAAVELVPELSEGMGLPFGTLVFGVMHEGVLPGMGVEEPHKDKDSDEERNELLTHFVYGFATEVVRHFVRDRMDD